MLFGTTLWSIYCTQYYTLLNELNYIPNGEHSKFVFLSAIQRNSTQDVVMKVFSHFKVHLSTYSVNIRNQIKYANI